jgi:hypothetical protein
VVSAWLLEYAGSVRFALMPRMIPRNSQRSESCTFPRKRKAAIVMCLTRRRIRCGWDPTMGRKCWWGPYLTGKGPAWRNFLYDGELSSHRELLVLISLPLREGVALVLLGTPS